MQNQWGLRKICRCTAPPRQLTENTPFLIFLQEKWSTKNVQNLNKILKTTVEGAKQWLSLQQQKIWKACLNKQVSQAASAPTEILWAFKNIELNAILYFNKMKAAISRDVENFQKLCRLRNIFSTAKSEAIWIRNSPACCNCVQFNIRLEVNKGKKMMKGRQWLCFRRWNTLWKLIFWEEKAWERPFPIPQWKQSVFFQTGPYNFCWIRIFVLSSLVSKPIYRHVFFPLGNFANFCLRDLCISCDFDLLQYTELLSRRDRVNAPQNWHVKPFGACVAKWVTTQNSAFYCTWG